MDGIMVAEGTLENGVHWTIFRPAGLSEDEYNRRLAAAVETATCDAVSRRIERDCDRDGAKVRVHARRISDGRAVGAKASGAY